MKKFMVFILLLCSMKSLALHQSGVFQHMEAAVQNNLNFPWQLTYSSAEFDISIEQIMFGPIFDQSLLTFNNFNLFTSTDNYFIPEITFNLVTGASEFDICTGSLPCVDLSLQNTSIDVISGFTEYFYNEYSGEGGDLFFPTEVLVTTQLLINEGSFSYSPQSLSVVGLVPVPPALLLFGSAFLPIFFVRQAKHNKAKHCRYARTA